MGKLSALLGEYARPEDSVDSSDVDLEGLLSALDDGLLGRRIKELILESAEGGAEPPEEELDDEDLELEDLDEAL